MNEFFQFEADFVESLRCIPMQVRYKLDTCGVKLKLSHWTQFSATERQALVEKPCSGGDVSAYREFLQQLVQQHTGAKAGELPIDPQPAWLNVTEVPQDLLAKAEEVGTTITLEQWQLLTPLQRFALIKLSRPSHENKNFVPALQEFHLV